MNYHKKKLIILLTIQVVLTIIHKILDKPTSAEVWVYDAGWHYWVGVAFGMYLLFYMFTLTCKDCGAKQIWRSFNILDWRWPEDKCWKCGKEIPKH